MVKTVSDSQRPELVKEEANKIIASVTGCVKRGEGKGTCHVFLDHSNKCQCGKIDLTKERAR